MCVKNQNLIYYETEGVLDLRNMCKIGTFKETKKKTYK